MLSNPTHIRNIDMDCDTTVNTRALNKMIDDAIGAGTATGPKPTPEMMINKVIGIPSPVASADRDDDVYRNQRFPVPRPQIHSNRASHAFSTSSRLRSLSTPKRIEYSHDEMSQVQSLLTRESGAYSRFRDTSEPRGRRYQMTMDNFSRSKNDDRSSVYGEDSTANKYRVRDQSPSQALYSFDDRSRRMNCPAFDARRESMVGGKCGERGIVMTGTPPQFSKSLYLRERKRHSRDQDSGVVDYRSDRLHDKGHNTMDRDRNFGRDDYRDQRNYSRSRDYEMSYTADSRRDGQQYDRYTHIDHDHMELQGDENEPAGATTVFRNGPMVQNVPCVIRQRKIVPVPSELTGLFQDTNDGKEHDPMMENIVIPRDLSDQTLSSKWKDDDTVELPKGQLSAEAAIAATAAASLIADPSRNEFDIDNAAKALSSIADPSTGDVSLVMKSSVADKPEHNSSVVPISYNSVKKNLEKSMTVSLTSRESNKPQGIAPMTAFEFWTRCALSVSTAIMETGTNPIQLAHKAAEAVMTHGTAKMKSNWLLTAEQDLRDVTNAVLDAISAFPGGSGEAIVTLVSTAILNEGCKSIAMESLIIPALLSKIN